MSENPCYDLMVLIDPDLPDDRHTEIVGRIKQQIDSGGGSLKGDADWGTRRLAYEIDHRPEAHYHLFQLEGGAELLNQLDRSLSIEDGVLRHRIIRLPGGAPQTPPRPAPQQGEQRPDAGRRQQPDGGADATEQAPADGEEQEAGDTASG